MLLEVLAAFIATVGFSFIFNVPKSQVAYCGLVGALGWLVYLLVINSDHSPVVASFLASILIAQSARILAKRRKMPVTIFLIPGIIPLVPGAGTYQTIAALFAKDYSNAAYYGALTFQLAGVIASAIVLVATIPKIFIKPTGQKQ